MANSVDVRNLTRTFGDFVAVNNVSFEIPEGSVFGFLGPNGAGKSTTIRLLLGILKVSSGEGTVLGLDIANQTDAIRRRVGYMAQRFALYEDLTVTENMTFFAGIYGLTRDRANKRVHHLVDQFRLNDYRRDLAANLPGGIRQRLAFAVSLLHDPAIVFLDEPTGAVDPALRRYFWDIIAELSQEGKTIMVTTHYMDEAERCDKICFINRGRVIAQGSPSQLKTDTVKGSIYGFEPTDRLRALDFLGREPGLKEPFPAGTAVRFRSEAGPLPPALESRLNAEGLLAGPVQSMEPTLEDVFLTLQGVH
jgi:ABC-2 type transport system ATP-binding protein